MPSDPKVSVVMPVHNGMPYLPQTIGSLLQQSFTDFELIVVDDGSTDATGDCVKGYADGRIRYHRQEKSGVAQARNQGNSLARAELIAVMDADDIALPNRLAQQVAHLGKEKDCTLVGCQTDEIDPAGNLCGERRFPVSDLGIRWQLAFSCPFLHPGVIYRKAAALQCGGYDRTVIPADDFRFLLQLVKNGKQVANLPDKLMRYRLHPNSLTARHSAFQNEVCARDCSEYAHAVHPQIQEDDFRALWVFLCSGEVPVTAGWPDLVAAFEAWRARFQPERSRVPDLNEWMSHIEQRLRWHCLIQARQTATKPWGVWKWLRLAKAFDPQNGTLRSMIGRWVRKRLQRNVQFAAAHGAQNP